MGDLESAANEIFLVAWFLLAVGGIWLFFISKNVPLKRRLHAPYMVGAGLIFILYMGLISTSEIEFGFGAIIVAFVTFINLRTIAFCNNCGATAFSQNPFLFARPTHCQRCGEQLD